MTELGSKTYQLWVCALVVFLAWVCMWIQNIIGTSVLWWFSGGDFCCDWFGGVSGGWSTCWSLGWVATAVTTWSVPFTFWCVQKRIRSLTTELTFEIIIVDWPPHDGAQIIVLCHSDFVFNRSWVVVANPLVKSVISTVGVWCLNIIIPNFSPSLGGDIFADFVVSQKS